jgi:hypothetical protein
MFICFIVDTLATMFLPLGNKGCSLKIEYDLQAYREGCLVR